jgi:hypothetical protein
MGIAWVRPRGSKAQRSVESKAMPGAHTSLSDTKMDAARFSGGERCPRFTAENAEFAEDPLRILVSAVSAISAV